VADDLSNVPKRHALFGDAVIPGSPYRERIGKIGLFLCRICAIVTPAMILSAAIRKPPLLTTILMRVRLTNLGALVRARRDRRV
jgi:hypothetical protein